MEGGFRMSKSCQKCGAILPDEAQFCDQCGQKMEDWITCKYCGAHVPAGTKFCTQCGTPMSDGNQQDFNDLGGGFQNSPPPFWANTPRRWLIGKIIVGVTGIIFALLILAVMFGETGQQVRQGYLTQYDASITVEEAFDNRFRNCEWSTERKNGSDYVIFHGYDPEMLLDWVVTFTVYDDSFEVSQIEVDGTNVNSDIEMYYLLSYIYTGNLDELMSDMFLAALFLA